MSRQTPATPQIPTAAAVNGTNSNANTTQQPGSSSLTTNQAGGNPVLNQNATAMRQTGDQLYAGMEKMNPELFALFYGSFVTQLIQDHRDVEVVDVELYKIGYNMGVRMVEEFFAKSGLESCATFFETVNVIANIALKMFLGVDADVVVSGSSTTTGGSSQSTRNPTDAKVYNIILKSNPLTDFVDTLPQGMEGLHYSNAIPGAITGALRMLSLVVECHFVQEKLKGAPQDEICVHLIEVVNEGYVDDEV